MKKKLLIRASIGFLFGMATMYFVPPLVNRGPLNRAIYSDALLARLGSPAAAVLLTLLVMGLFGAVCMGGTLFYEIERWPLALATAAHYLSISLGYLIPNRALGWNLSARLLLIIEGFMTLGFFLIWLILCLSYKAQVRRLNELIRDREENAAEAEEKNESQ